MVEILEKFFQNEANSDRENVTQTIAKVPTEGEWFEVNIQTINQDLFRDERADRKQEQTRQLILEAFEEVKKAPEKYGTKFKTMMPNNAWTGKTVEELKQLACKLGDHNADWVEQALEWAQRICNGESWETICNNADIADWHRLVVWKNGYARLVGGSRIDDVSNPASYVFVVDYNSNDWIYSTLPLVVLYEEKNCPLYPSTKDGAEFKDRR